MHDTALLLNEAKLLCWMIAKAIDDVVNNADTPHEVIVDLSCMLQSVTQLMIGRSHPAVLVANDLVCALARVERHGINLELGDAITRFVAIAHDDNNNPTLAVIKGEGVTFEEKEQLHERA